MGELLLLYGSLLLVLALAMSRAEMTKRNKPEHMTALASE
jgi:hypothetical protein